MTLAIIKQAAKQIAIDSLILGACLAVATWVFYEIAMAVCG